MRTANLKKLIKKKAKGQTALEYALVVAAISLVLMVAWNQVGDELQGLISGTMKDRLSEQISRGNSGVRR